MLAVSVLPESFFSCGWTFNLPHYRYVMQRSFGEFDPTTTALFKFKSQAAGCGQYAQSEVDAVANEPLPNPFVLLLMPAPCAYASVILGPIKDKIIA